MYQYGGRKEEKTESKGSKTEGTAEGGRVKMITRGGRVCKRENMYEGKIEMERCLFYLPSCFSAPC